MGIDYNMTHVTASYDGPKIQIPSPVPYYATAGCLSVNHIVCNGSNTLIIKRI